jgi:lipopolysaccharide/colanic/teichoic acid biosynthesis glycosyltransferase
MRQPSPAPARARRRDAPEQRRRAGVRRLMAADWVTVFGLALTISLVRFGGEAWPTEPLAYTLAAFALAAGIHVVVSYFGGLYEPEPRLGRRPQLPRLAGITLIAVSIDVLVAFVTEQYLMPTINLGVLLLLAPVALAGNRWLARRQRLRREGLPRVLLAGTPADVLLAKAHLAADDEPVAEIAGETGGGDEDLLLQVTERGASDVLLLSSRLLDGIYPEPLTTLERRGVGLLQRVSARDTLLGLRGVREIGGMPFVRLSTQTLPASRARFKRCLELVGIVAAAPILLLVTGAVALYVRVVAGPGVIYRQDRVGQGGRVFRMLKFRTMPSGAEEGLGPTLASRNDPRVLPACRWLRERRVDELPQIWNVLRGEMSVVGPRPERPELTASYEALIPGYARRHEIPPGITGLAQISGRYHTDPEYKLGHDLQYLVNWSPVLDLQILGRTLWVLLAGRN